MESTESARYNKAVLRMSSKLQKTSLTQLKDQVYITFHEEGAEVQTKDIKNFFSST